MLNSKAKSYLNLRLHYLKYILQNLLLSFRVKGSSIDLYIESKNLISVLLFLKKHSAIRATNLLDLTVVDEMNTQNSRGRYRCIYSLLSITYNLRINVHVHTDKSLLSVTKLFYNADWLEREAWDMFGIIFQNHQDLRRILSDYQFKGFPLRKDFPVMGYTELFYFDAEARIVYLPINLIQEYKQFKFKTSW